MIKFKKGQYERIYYDACLDEITNVQLKPFTQQLSLICNRIQYSPEVMEEIIDVLEDLYKDGRINFVNDKLVDLIVNICGEKGKCDMPDDFLNCLCVLTFKPKKEYENDDKCIGDFHDCCTSLSFFPFPVNPEDLDEFSKLDCTLANLLREYCDSFKIIYEKFPNNMNYRNILFNVSRKIFTHLYFNIEYFKYKYDLLTKTITNIVEDFQAFINGCNAYGVYGNNFTGIELYNEITDEIKAEIGFTGKILEQTYKQPVKVLRKEGV